MKSSAVDAWLQHWLKMQKKGKCPLVLKNSLDKDHDSTKEPTIVDRWNSKKSKPGYIKPNEDNEVNIDNSILDAAQSNAKGGTNGQLLPKSLHSVASTQTSHQKFLASLSDNQDYKKLLLLLLAAKVRSTLSISALTNKWIGWRNFGGISSCLGIMGIHQLLPFQGFFQSQILVVALGLYTLDWNGPDHH